MSRPAVESNPQELTAPPRFGRRALLAAAGCATLGGAAWALSRRNGGRASVFVARQTDYGAGLARTLEDGLRAVGIDVARFQGQRVLLKPNLVEPSAAAPHMTTHPAFVLAAAEVFQRLGATVTVGEAPGHLRDTELALEASGLGVALESAGLPFADLNYQQTGWIPNAGRTSRLNGFYFPQAILEADWVVSLPKLKTHHWVGMTAAMKNLYGTLPGIRYGWPKNVLHHAGIPQSVVDIGASLPRTIALVDGIVGMEGDGPIMGSPKAAGVVVVGANLIAVDATCARLMQLRPERISYLALAEGRFGPLAESRISQRGERWQDLSTPFAILDRPHLRELRDAPTAVLTTFHEPAGCRVRTTG